MESNESDLCMIQNRTTADINVQELFT